LLLLVGVFAGLQATALAQTRPTISPWMQMFNRNTGPLDNYHTYVRPQMELNDQLRSQNAAIQRNRTDVSSLGQDVNRMQDERRRPIRPTGANSVFGDYSHYFPSTGQHSAFSTAVNVNPAAQRSRAWAPKPARSSMSAMSGM
jgi:hypothetical protein